jgi:predicted component of type VI protein secretion system
MAVALLLAQSFSEAGWGMRSGALTEIDGLPLHLYETDGGATSKPCAEVLLTEDAAEHALEKGLIPLVSFKDRDMARVLRLQSIADPPQPLAGRWAS